MLLIRKLLGQVGWKVKIVQHWVLGFIFGFVFFFFSVRIWHKILFFTDKKNLQLSPSFDINLAVFIYTRSTLDWFQNLTVSCPIPNKTRTRLYSSYIIIHLDKFLAAKQPGHSRQLGSKYYYS